MISTYSSLQATGLVETQPKRAPVNRELRTWCTRCNGSGQEPCSCCKGEGYSGGGVCETCDGSGEGEGYCAACEGKKWVTAK